MRVAVQTATAVSIVFTLVLACGGCASSKPRAKSTPSSAGNGTVAGTLQLTGGPPGAAVLPVAGEVSAFTSISLSGPPVATVKTGSDGRFSLSLRPGTYYLAASSPSYSLDPPSPTPPCRGEKPAVVSVDSTTRIDVACQRK
jgi:hypothetical protein